MSGLLWIALAAGGLLAGLGTVATLAIPSGKELLGGAVTLGGLFLSAWTLGRLIAEYQTASTPVVALALGLGSYIGGYALASTMLAQISYRPQSHTINAAEGDRAAILLLSDAEPDTYSPAATAHELTTLQDDGVLRLGIVSTPFLFAAQKARYRAIGGSSPARRQVREIAEAVEQCSAGLGFHSCAPAWCSGPGNLLEQVESLARTGHSRVVIVPLGIAESLEMVRAKLELDGERASDAAIRIAHATPLRSVEAIAAFLVRRISAGITEPDQTGVALLAHGQPEAQADVNPAFDEDETTFLNQIKTQLSEGGTPLESVRIASVEWHEPDVTETVRHLAALGCSRILVCPACHPVDGISTLLDVQMSVQQARVESETSVVMLSTWHNEPEVVESLCARAASALHELAGRAGSEA